MEALRPFLPAGVARALDGMAHPEKLEEIRLRAGGPICVRTDGWHYLTSAGLTCGRAEEAYTVTEEDCETFFARITGQSAYALQTQLSQLYLSLPGGIRVGLAGTVTCRDGRILTVRHCRQFVIRIPRAAVGCARIVLPYLRVAGQVRSALILSPPGAGKTTLLRDIAASLSGRTPAGTRVCVLDERGELAAVHQGKAGFFLGLNTDIIDACPKAEGLRRAVRVLAPEVVITDEIGSAADAAAIAEAARVGVRVIASAHADDPRSAALRPGLRTLLTGALFDRVVLLSHRRGPGTLEGVFDARFRRLDAHGATGT